MITVHPHNAPPSLHWLRKTETMIEITKTQLEASEWRRRLVRMGMWLSTVL